MKPRIPITSTAFRITFGVGAGAAAAYVALEFMNAAIPTMAEHAGKLVDDWRAVRTARKEKTP